jgi:UPF0755 protein
MKRKKGRRNIIVALTILIALLVLGLIVGSRTYTYMYKPNVDTKGKEQVFIRIATGSTFSEVLNNLHNSGYLKDTVSFKNVASRMGYQLSVKPGRYKLTTGMSNRALIANLRAGIQTPVRVTFTGFRTPHQLAGKIASQLEPDSVSILAALTSAKIAEQYGFSPETFIAMFIPNTYEFYWNTSVEGFLDRMKREYETFWNEERTYKSAEMGLTKLKVSILASIVEEETIFSTERPRVAGVYINRLERGIPLQADPTVKFAVGDFALRRILTRHLKVDSPYNTYLNRGLPPGPINSPSISSIDAVLNHEQHQYLYFCAKSDFSGYHAFAKTLAEHNRNAREYQNALNRQRIFR